MPKKQPAKAHKPIRIKVEPSPDMTDLEWELIKRRSLEAVKKVLSDAGWVMARAHGDDP
jgi:hypothetical protein